MDAFRQHKETENKVHESLYTNLTLLSAYYPTTKEFDAVFRKDMFVKNNKAAFFEVIHYLLYILNPELTKQKLISWPLYDIKREAKFRSELVGYINELNSIYENADIPTCQPSSLISPGGFRFAKFMLKISQLVVYNHLKKTGELSQLYSLKPHKKYSIRDSILNKAQLNHLKMETPLIDKETNDLLEEFKTHHGKVSAKAEQITGKLTEVNANIQNARTKLVKTREEFNLKYPSYPSVESLEEKIEILKIEAQKIMELRNLFTSSENLLLQISSASFSIEHNEENFSVPIEISHIITNKKELNLIEFFKGLTVLLERRALELRDPTRSCIEQTIQAINVQSSKYQTILKQLENQQERINNLRDELGALFNEVSLKNTDADLAVPLSL